MFIVLIVRGPFQQFHSSWLKLHRSLSFTQQCIMYTDVQNLAMCIFYRNIRIHIYREKFSTAGFIQNTYKNIIVPLLHCVCESDREKNILLE